MVFTGISLRANDVDHLFMVSLATRMSSREKCLDSFTLVLERIAVFLLSTRGGTCPVCLKPRGNFPNEGKEILIPQLPTLWAVRSLSASWGYHTHDLVYLGCLCLLSTYN